ncbi:hypothetical protein PBV87_20185 [Niameybacter massiliensis]|uniref:Uncharacterized protein n=1 Tax=Holtiella tumoricola TaxID=3018743 RepID=A0AA42DRG9_9FIRM|nr:hypothetical protein [Holtiella tumoricola]MDA3733795.1 hypothetical protein [Holtiella tumoricola]
MKRSQQGNILFVVIIVFAVVLLLGTGLLTITTATHKDAIRYVDKKQASNMAKSALEILVYYFENEPKHAKELLPDDTFTLITSDKFQLKDNSDRKWENQLTLQGIGNDQFKITAYVKLDDSNKMIEDSQSVIIQGVRSGGVSGISGNYVETVGSFTGFTKGNIFAKDKLIIKDTATGQDIDMNKIASLGGILVEGIRCKFNVEEVYSEGDITIDNCHMQGYSQIKTIKFSLDAYDYKVVGSSGMSDPNTIKKQQNMPGWVTEAIDQVDGIEAPSWVTTYGGDTAEIVKVTTDTIYDSSSSLPNKIFTDQDNITITIQNISGVTKNLEIYNPKGNVILQWNGNPNQTIFKGGITANKIHLKNNHKLIFDCEPSENVVNGGFKKFEVLQYMD